MSLYRVRPGFSFGAQNQHGPGDLVELSAAEAAGFADKLEPAADAELPTVADTSTAAKPKPRSAARPAAHNDQE